jgi:hypothetical protein
MIITTSIQCAATQCAGIRTAVVSAVFQHVQWEKVLGYAFEVKITLLCYICIQFQVFDSAMPFKLLKHSTTFVYNFN